MKKLSPDYNLKACYPEVAKFWDYEKNGDLLPEEVMPSSGRRAWFFCAFCGESIERSAMPSKGKPKRCTNCQGLKYNKDTLLLMFNEKHKGKYIYPELRANKVKEKIDIVCPKHGMFRQQISLHLNGSGCNSCASDKLSKMHMVRDTKSAIKSFRSVHGDSYEYSKFNYSGAKVKSIIVCRVHGEFLQDFSSHFGRKNGCPKCGDQTTANKRRNDFDTIIEKCNKIHNNRYDYSKFVYKNSSQKGIIVCPIHGSFEKNMRSHMYNKKGCRSCGIESGAKKKAYTFEDFLKKANETHSGKYEYIKESYTCYTKKVDIICKKHGIFRQQATLHAQRSSCPRCKSSKGEQLINKFLKLKGIVFLNQKSFKECKDVLPLKFDFYIPKQKGAISPFLIEYQGEQHYKPVEIFGGKKGYENAQRKDNIKRKFCKDNNIKLLEIPYWEKKNIENILDKQLRINNIKSKKEYRQLVLF